jgi:Na+/melibiose symporter-like transporter
VILLAAPALPLHSAGKYVAGAYIVFVVMLLVYLTIMSIRTSRTERELAELREELAARRRKASEPQAETEPEREAVGSK